MALTVKLVRLTEISQKSHGDLAKCSRGLLGSPPRLDEMRSRGWLMGLGLLGLGCGQELGRVRQTTQGVIVGDDDRLDVYQLTSDSRRVTSAVAALMYAHRVAFPSPNAAELRALPSSEALDLCPEEPFRSQPVAAYCSGVLIDDTLLATAGHCLGGDWAQASERCERIHIVFGYEARGESTETVLSPLDIFSCRRVVALERDSADLAIVELDRPVQGREPARLGGTRPARGDRLLVASHGAGLPLKVELAAQVVDAPDSSEYFVAATDTFAGGSGGGLFNEKLDLAGMVLRGVSDWEFVGDCQRATRESLSEEEHGHTSPRVIETLRALNWPSPRLFGTDHRCGDGVCGSTESNESCAADCLPAICGDHICEVVERQTCFDDCHRYDVVPERWAGDPELGRLAFKPEPTASPGSNCSLSRHNTGKVWSSTALALVTMALLTMALRRRGAPRDRRIGGGWGARAAPPPITAQCGSGTHECEVMPRFPPVLEPSRVKQA